MFVNRYTINIATVSTASTANYINIPINMEYQFVDQAELVERVFVEKEIQKNINPIFDYEKVRFIPSGTSIGNVNKITYSVEFLSGTTYGSIGFNDDDIKFAKNNFKNSFLNLAFYDSPNALEQRLISVIDLYPHLSQIDLYDNTAVFPQIPGQPRPANQIQVSFILSNPIYNPRGNAEGYHLYNYKDEVLSGTPKELYMKATFKNAKTGKSTNLMVDNTPHTIDVLVGKLYTKYVLVRNNTGYFYKIDETYNSDGTTTPNNVTYVGNDVTIRLYQIQAI